MARLLKELVYKPHPTTKRFISTFFNQQNSPSNFILTPLLFTNQSVLNALNPHNNGLGSEDEENGATHLGKSAIYPSFSVGYFQDPNMPSGLGLLQVLRRGNAPEVEHPGTIWADSVKKKRKKKMNKHKYKKLRKRLRRKTKT